MTIKRRLFVLGCVLSFNTLAASYLPAIEVEETHNNRWSFVASVGYGQYQNVYLNDGQTPLGRFAIAAELLTTTNTAFGLEVGVQNGNSMRFFIPPNTLDIFGDVVRTTVKPMLDFLITANTTPITESLLFTQFKGGIAYRQWQIESWVGNRSELSGEVQAGFGYPLTEVTSLNLLYQGIFGGTPKFNPTIINESHFSNIPIQHGVLLGLSIIA